MLSLLLIPLSLAFPIINECGDLQRRAPMRILGPCIAAAAISSASSLASAPLNPDEETLFTNSAEVKEDDISFEKWTGNGAIDFEDMAGEELNEWTGPISENENAMSGNEQSLRNWFATMDVQDEQIKASKLTNSRANEVSSLSKKVDEAFNPWIDQEVQMKADVENAFNKWTNGPAVAKKDTVVPAESAKKWADAAVPAQKTPSEKEMALKNWFATMNVQEEKDKAYKKWSQN